MPAYRFGRCRLDTQARELSVDGTPVHVEPQVFDVLGYLLAHRDRLVPKTELLHQVWGDQFVSESALTSRLKSARRAIGDDGAAQTLIRTERGRGYRFVGEVRVDGDAPDRPAALGALPAARLSLVGRQADLAAVAERLGTHRLVTVTGPGGVGKSTLAVAVARGRDRVAFVELAPVHRPADVVRAVAEATGVQGAGAADPDVLARNLAGRDLLVVLDNCEHLLDVSAALVDRLLDADPGLRVLATSREPLGVDGEAVHRLGSLGPDAAHLFARRAAAATGHDAVTADDPAVRALCERLDGLPLAIELAAAQLRHLTLADLVRRLDDSLAVLVGGRPRSGARHATLAGTIGWSHDLLAPASRAAFAQLGVFPASFDLAAVRAVTGADPVAVMADLVAKSLVTLDPVTGRYRLLETIRLFAASRLAEPAAAVERLRRHVVARNTAVPRPGAWLSARLAAANRDDIENVRLAFEASIAAGRYADAVDVMVGLSSLWRNAASYAEGRRWTATLGRHDLTPRDRLWLHLVEADIGLGAGDPRLLFDAGAAAVELSSTVDDEPAALVAAIYRALVTVSREPDRTVADLDAVAARARAAGEPGLDRLARAFRGMALLVAARPDEAKAAIAELGEPTGDGYDRYITVWAAWTDALGDRDGPRLRRWMDAQLANVRESGLRENWLSMFSMTLTLIGEGADWRPYLSRARRHAEAEGRRADVDCVFALAYAAACRDDHERAAELLGATGGTLFHDTANFIHHLVVRDRTVRPRLAPADYEAAVARGRRLSIADVLAAEGL